MGTSSIEGSSKKEEKNSATKKKIEKPGSYDPIETEEKLANLIKSMKMQGEELAALYKMQMQEQNNPQPKRQIPLSLEALERSGLESNNFRVDSSKWEMGLDLLSGVEYLINPEGDIIELKVNGKKEQFFSQEAAIRETKIYSKNPPTKEQLEQMSISYGQDGEKFSKQLGLQAVGYWDPLKKKYYNDGSGFYWALDSNGKLGQCIHFNRSRIGIYSVNNSKNFLPVRCIRN